SDVLPHPYPRTDHGTRARFSREERGYPPRGPDGRERYVLPARGGEHDVTASPFRGTPPRAAAQRRARPTSRLRRRPSPPTPAMARDPRRRREEVRGRRRRQLGGVDGLLRVPVDVPVTARLHDDPGLPGARQHGPPAAVARLGARELPRD